MVRIKEPSFIGIYNYYYCSLIEQYVKFIFTKSSLIFVIWDSY